MLLDQAVLKCVLLHRSQVRANDFQPRRLTKSLTWFGGEMFTKSRDTSSIRDAYIDDFPSRIPKDVYLTATLRGIVLQELASLCFEAELHASSSERFRCIDLVRSNRSAVVRAIRCAG